jgi:hypothetical protein
MLMRQDTRACVVKATMARTVSSLVQIVTQILANTVVHVSSWMGVVIVVTVRQARQGSSVNWMPGMSVQVIHARVERCVRTGWETMDVTALTHGEEKIVTSITLASVQGGANLLCLNPIESPPTLFPQLIQTWRSNGQSVLSMDVERNQATCSVMKNATHMHAILMAMTVHWVSIRGTTARRQLAAGRCLWMGSVTWSATTHSACLTGATVRSG